MPQNVACRPLAFVMAGIVAWSTWLAAATVAADPPPVACWIEVPHMDEWASKWQETGLGQLLRGTAAEPLRAELDRSDAASLLRLRPWFGFDWLELSEVPATVRLFVFAGPEGNPAAACTIVAGDDASKPAIDRCLAAGRQYHRAAGAAIESSEGAGTIRTIVRSPGPARTDYFLAPDGSLTVLYARGAQADLAIDQLAASRADLLAGRLDGGTPRAATERTATDEEAATEIKWYVAPLPLLQLLAQEQSDGWLESVKRQGVGRIESVSGGLRIRPREGMEFEIAGTLSGSIAAQQAVGLLDFASPEPLDAADWLAPQATSVTSWTWDFASAMESFGRLFDETAEPGPDGEGLFSDLLDGLRDDPEGPQVDLRGDVFAHLGPRVTWVVQGEDREGDGSPNSPQELYAIECRNRAQVETALTRFYDGDSSVEREVLGGSIMWSVGENQTVFVEGEGESLAGWRAVALVGEKLLVGTHPELIRWAIRRTRAARSVGEWDRVLGWLGESGVESSLARAARPGDALRDAYRELRGGVSEKSSWRAKVLGRAVFGFRLDGIATKETFGLLPEYDRVEPALGRLGLTAALAESGLSFRAVLLRGT